MNKITKADNMFKNTTNIKSIDISDLKNIDTATSMFEGCDAPTINWGSMKPKDATGAFLNYNASSYPWIINVDDLYTSGYITENKDKMNLRGSYQIIGYEVPKVSKVKYSDLKIFATALNTKEYYNYNYPEYTIELDATDAPESYFHGTSDAPSQLSSDLSIIGSNADILLNLDITIPDTVTNLDYALSGLSCLWSLNIKGGKNVTSAEGMLQNSTAPQIDYDITSRTLIKGCNEFTSLVNASYMFSNCYFEGITSGFDKVENASYMFNGCDVNNIDFSLFKSVTNASNMFSLLDSLNIVISEAFTETTNASNMFNNISNAKIVIDGMNKVTDATNMFNNIEKGDITINGLNGVITAKNLFNNVGDQYNSYRSKIAINGLNGVTNATNMFISCRAVIDLTFINSFSNVENATNMFNVPMSNDIVDLTSMKKLSITTNMFNSRLSEIKFDNFSSLTEFQNMFSGVSPEGLHIITTIESQSWVNQNKVALGLDGKMYFFEDGWENVVLDYSTIDSQLAALDKLKRYSFTFTGLENAAPNYFTGNASGSGSPLSIQLNKYGLIYKVILSLPDNITDLSYCFGNSNLISLDIIKANGVTNIDGLLYRTNNIKKFSCKNLGKATTANNFAYGSNLKELDISDLTSVSNASYMFYNTSDLNVIGLDKAGKSFTDTSYMFSHSKINVKKIDLDATFPNTENICHMFDSCYGEIEEVSSVSPNSKINNVVYAFYASIIKKVSLKNKLVTDIESIFEQSFLESIELDLPNVIYANNAFSQTNITDIDISSMVSLSNADDMFNHATLLKNVTYGSIRPIYVNHMFKSTAIETFDCSLFEKAKETTNLFNSCKKLKTVSNAIFKNCIYAQKMFQKSSIENFIGEIDFSNATSVSRMFHGCSNLRQLDISSFTSTESLYIFFADAINLKTVTWNKLPASGYLEAYSMFSNTYDSEKGKIIIKTESQAVMDYVNENWSTMRLKDGNGNPNYEFFDAININTTYENMSSDLSAYVTNGKSYNVNVDTSSAPSQGFKGTKEVKSEFNSLTDAAYEKSKLNLKFNLPKDANDISYMLADNTKIISLNIPEVQTTGSIVANNMLQNCSNLKKINLDSIKEITNASEMLIGCSSLEKIDISKFTSITDASRMLSNCSNLKEVIWGSIRPENVTDIFKGSTADKIIRVGDEETKKWIEDNVSLMGLAGNYRVIYGTLYDELEAYVATLEPGTYDLVVDCYGVPADEFISSSEWNQSPFGQKLYSAPSGVYFNLKPINIDPSITDFTRTFNKCSEIKTIDLSRITNITIADYMLNGCSSLTTVIGTSGFTSVTDANGMLSSCRVLASVDTSGFINVKSANDMFSGCTSLTEIDYSNLTNVKSANGMFNGCTSLTSIDCSNFANITDANSMFSGCTSLAAIDLSGFTNVTSASRMFYNCSALASVTGTSGFTNVTNTDNMFYNCSVLTSIDTSGFVNVTNTGSMFNSCTSLTAIDYSNFANATDAYNMFYNCNKITDVNISVPVKLTNARYMFQNCSSLATIDISNAKGIKDISNMFQYCNALNYINWGSIEPTSFNSAFYGCNLEKTIKVDNYSITKFIDANASAMSLTSYVYAEMPDVPAEFTTTYAEVDNYLPYMKNQEYKATITDVPASAYALNSEGTCEFNNKLKQVDHAAVNLTASVPAETTDLSNAFKNLNGLKTLSVTGAGAVTNITSIVEGCQKLTSVTLDDWSSVTTADNALMNCPLIASFDTAPLVKLTSAKGMFNGCTAITTINTAPFYNLEDCSSLFRNTNINNDSIDLLNFTKLKNAQSMLEGTKVTKIDLTGTSTLTNINSIVKNCPTVKSIKMNAGNIATITDFTSAFENTAAIDKVFDPSNDANTVVWMYNNKDVTKSGDYDLLITDDSVVPEKMTWEETRIWKGGFVTGVTHNLTVDLTGAPKDFANSTLMGEGGVYKTSELGKNLLSSSYTAAINLTLVVPNNILDLSGCFTWCNYLRSVKVEESSLGRGVSNAKQMFYGCNYLERVDFEGYNLSSADGMFGSCTNLTSFKTRMSMNGGAPKDMFIECPSYKVIKVGTKNSYDFFTGNETTLGLTNYEVVADTSIDWNIPSRMTYNDLKFYSPLYKSGQEYNLDITDTISEDQVNASGSNKSEFAKLISASGAKFNRLKANVNASNVVGLLYYCDVKDPLIDSHLDINDMSYSFAGTSLNNPYHYSNTATVLSYAYADCKNVTEVDLSYYKKMIDARGMFKDCTNLKDIYLSRISESDIGKYLSNKEMFYGCTAQKTIHCTQAQKDLIINSFKDILGLDDNIVWSIVA